MSNFLGERDVPELHSSNFRRLRKIQAATSYNKLSTEESWSSDKCYYPKIEQRCSKQSCKAKILMKDSAVPPKAFLGKSKFGFIPASRCQENYVKKKDYNNKEDDNNNKEDQSENRRRFSRLEEELEALVRPKSAPINTAAAQRRRRMQAEASTKSLMSVQTSRVYADDKTDFTSSSNIIEVFQTSSRGNKKIVLKICKESPLAVLAYSLNNFTALHHASRNGNWEIVRILLLFGAKINALSADGENALHLASYHGHSKVVSLLLSHNNSDWDIDSKNKQGETALFHACMKSHPEIVRDILVVGKANPDIKDRYGDLPDDVAKEKEILKLLSESRRRIQYKMFSGLHSEIATRIFLMLPHQDLNICRQVSHDWLWLVNRIGPAADFVNFKPKKSSIPSPFGRIPSSSSKYQQGLDTTVSKTTLGGFSASSFLLNYSPK